jgi:hypothetical protein
VAIVRADADSGSITVHASAPGVAPASITVPVRPAAALAPLHSF